MILHGRRHFEVIGNLIILHVHCLSIDIFFSDARPRPCKDGNLCLLGDLRGCTRKRSLFIFFLEKTETKHIHIGTHNFLCQVNNQQIIFFLYIQIERDLFYCIEK